VKFVFCIFCSPCISSDYEDSDPEIVFSELGHNNSEQVPTEGIVSQIDTTQSILHEVPRHIFTIEEINRPADQGVIIPPSIVPNGSPTGKSRKIVLWEQTVPAVIVNLSLQQRYITKCSKVESLYKTPDGTKYWKIYIEHEYMRLTQDTEQFQYRVYRN
jgi:hypothetical protein